MKNRKADSSKWLVIMAFAFGIECYRFLSQRNIQDLSVLDFYVLNALNSSLVENLLCWMIPLISAFACGKQFNAYYPLRKAIFTRTDRKKVVLQKAAESAARSFLLVLFFYLCCFLFDVIIAEMACPEIRFGVSLNLNSGVMYPSLYFARPVLYLDYFVIMISGYAAAFGMAGFLISCFTRNRAAVAIGPFAVMIVLSIVLLAVPGGLGSLFDFTSVSLLQKSWLATVPKPVQSFFNFIGPLVYLVLFRFMIRSAAEKEKPWQ